MSFLLARLPKRCPSARVSHPLKSEICQRGGLAGAPAPDKSGFPSHRQFRRQRYYFLPTYANTVPYFQYIAQHSNGLYRNITLSVTCPNQVLDNTIPKFWPFLLCCLSAKAPPFLLQIQTRRTSLLSVAQGSCLIC